MTGLWDQYVYRRGTSVEELWEEMFLGREARVLYIAGAGFDTRVTAVLSTFLECVGTAGISFAHAKLALVYPKGYELGESLAEQTEQNEARLKELFAPLGDVVPVNITLADLSPEFRVSHSLQQISRDIGSLLQGYTDVILDVSSLPRIVYLSLITTILELLIPARGSPSALAACKVNFQVLVAEDAALDAQIRSEDPSEDLVIIPGYGGGIKVEAMAEWPVVWFPILGEGKTSQADKVSALAEIPAEAEVCPVLPHPSRNPRRGDELLIEYRQQFFRARRPTSVSNVMFVHEAHPFEAYRQLRGAISRYAESLGLLGGCRILVTPLSSKLLTIATALACFEMRPAGDQSTYALGLPCATPTRYVVERAALLDATPELSSLLLTGTAYESS
jgi:hypothetical protein